MNIENAISCDVTQYGGNAKSDGCLGFIQSQVWWDNFVNDVVVSQEWKENF